MFVDEVEVELESGAGGDGSASFHREKHVPRGGPNGADGGRGGSVIVRADRHKRTLQDFRLQRHIRAESGSHARGNKMGKHAEDVILQVPVGTTLTDLETGDVIVDLTFDGSEFTVCKGGRGGQGNLHFTNSYRQAPSFAQKGAPGDTRRVKMELKLLADVGLVGLPNAGKSTFLTSVSAAKPKIADYPFTTLEPQLGVVAVDDQSFVIADLPGLIEGASAGHGLGHRFLRHVERTKLILHLVEVSPLDESDPVQNFEMIENELAEYSPELADRTRLVVLTKIDVLGPDGILDITKRFADKGLEVFPVSAVAQLQIEPLLRRVSVLLAEAEAAEVERVPVITPAAAKSEEPKYSIEWMDHPDDPEERILKVTGRRVLEMVAMTDLSHRDAVRHLHRRLERMGVIEALRENGASDGTTVAVGDFVFEFSDQE